MGGVNNMYLNDYQIKALEEMKDSRAVDPKLLNAVVDKHGAMNVFLRFVQEHEELNICFRGNNSAIEIYYYNHVVWKLSAGKNRCWKVSFNIGHAKDMPNEVELRKYFKDHDFKMKPDGKTIYMEKSHFTEEDINNDLWCRFKEIMDYYFNPSNGSPNIEKRWQHKFFKDFHNDKYIFDGLYIYDLEYHQKLPHKEDLFKIWGLKTDEELKEMRVHSTVMKTDLVPANNEPDFLGVEFDKGKNEACLIFGEIKSLYDTCGGQSGIYVHLDRMREYLNLDVLIKKRKDEAEAILKQYAAIGDINDSYCFDGLSEKLSVKNVLVLTNSQYFNEEQSSVVEWDGKLGAIKYFEDNRDSIIEKARASECEIWLLNNIRCDDDRVISMNNITRLNKENNYSIK